MERIIIVILFLFYAKALVAWDEIAYVCEGHYHNEWWPWQYGPTCLPDKSGWFEYDCEENYDDTKEEYIYSGKKVNHICPAGSYCICPPDTECSKNELCFRPPDDIPEFVQQGVLNSHGTSVADDGEEVPSTHKLRGLTIKDESGFFFKERTKWDWDKRRHVQSYDIIIPEGEVFVKYSGDFAGTSCSAKKVSKSEALFNIGGIKNWEKTHSWKKYDGSREEEWSKTFNYNDGYEKQKWTILFDKGSQKAYPTDFYKYYLDEGEADYTDNVKYNYKGFVEDEDCKWFDFSTYCNQQLRMSKGKNLTPKICVFPFTYHGKTYNECTKDEASYLWCSLDKKYDSRWIKC